tara:strand:+ start:118 stop:279 length:162 start_codon:yes stop_codon:yes gene_type:complete
VLNIWLLLVVEEVVVPVVATQLLLEVAVPVDLEQMLLAELVVEDPLKQHFQYL